MDVILDNFSESMALIETAFTALETTQESEEGKGIADPMVTFERGLIELRRTYTQLEIALKHYRRPVS